MDKENLHTDLIDKINEIKNKEKNQITEKEINEIKKLQDNLFKRADELEEKVKELKHNSIPERPKFKEEKVKESIVNKQEKKPINKYLVIFLVIISTFFGIFVFKNLNKTTKEEVDDTSKIVLADYNQDIRIVDVKDNEENIETDLEDETVEIDDEIPEVEKEKTTQTQTQTVTHNQKLQNDIDELDKTIDSLEGRNDSYSYNSNAQSNPNKGTLSFFRKGETKTSSTNKSSDDITNDILETFLGKTNGNTTTELDKDLLLTNKKNVLFDEIEHTVSQGSIIPAILITEINTDIAGDIIAQVREDIYDTKTGYKLLIPKGSKLYGRYNSVISNGQSRVMIAFDRLTLPNNKYVNLSAMQGTDALGRAGFKDKVDNHTFELIGNAILSSVLNLGNTLSKGVSFEVGSVSVGLNGKEKSNGESSGFEKSINKLVDRSVDRQPTITIRKGYEFNILVNDNIKLEEYNYRK